ncbi:MAG: hypothetical protein RL179_2047 [Planctomycetota bacterium]|jgi:hypothetical protein
MRRLSGTILAVAVFFVAAFAQAQGAKGTAKAQATQKLLEKKITVEFKETKLADIIDEIKDQVKGIQIRMDGKGGVSGNRKLSFTGKDVTLKDTLEGLLKKEGLCYGITSNEKDAYDGSVYIRVGTEFGTLINKK